MSKTSLSRALLLAGLVAAAGIAQAQTTTDVPLQAGEASTMTYGQPNMETAPLATMGAGPAVVYQNPDVYIVPSQPVVKPHLQRSDAYVRGSFGATCNTPTQAGEASTMTHGQPNASTFNTVQTC